MKFSFYLQNMYEIDNLVIVLTHSDYMSQYINLTLKAQLYEADVNCSRHVHRLVYIIQDKNTPPLPCN